VFAVAHYSPISKLLVLQGPQSLLLFHGHTRKSNCVSALPINAHPQLPISRTCMSSQPFPTRSLTAAAAGSPSGCTTVGAADTARGGLTRSAPGLRNTGAENLEGEGAKAASAVPPVLLGLRVCKGSGKKSVFPDAVDAMWFYVICTQHKDKRQITMIAKKLGRHCTLQDVIITQASCP